jgi:anti-sigma regulatory factor (Ser/Thr protein kinase)
MPYPPLLASCPAESPTVSGCCPLSPSPDAASRARTFTRRTLASWGLDELIADAEIIVSELLANAIRHAWTGHTEGGTHTDGPGLALWLLRDSSAFMCVVTDPSDAAPALQQPGPTGENGRGLHVIHALSDHWGWSAFAEHGKAVWAILFHG